MPELDLTAVPDAAPAFPRSAGAWEALPVLELDPAGCVSGWSPGAAEMTGYRAQEVHGKPAAIFYPPDAQRRDLPAAELARAAEHGRAEAEGWWTRRDGGRVWVRRFFWRIAGGDGRSAGTGVLLCDLTARHAAEQRLAERDAWCRAVLEQSPDPVFVLNRAGRITEANPAAERMLGSTAPAAGQAFADLADARGRETARGAVQAALSGRTAAPRLELSCPGAPPASVRALLLPVRVDGGVGSVLALCTPLAPGGDGDGAQGDARFRALVEECRDAFFFETDAAGRLAYLSPSARALTGRSPSELLGRTFTELRADSGHGADGDPFPALVGLAGSDGGIRTFELAWEPRERTGRAARGFARDVTRQRALERELMHSALHDPLTGLPNRAVFWERLGQTMRMWVRAPDRRFAVLMLDVDNFKLINDTFGHRAGDEALAGISRRLAACVRPGDTVSRYGGDEFAVLLDDIGDPSDAGRVAVRIEAALAEPLDVAGEEIFALASIGIAFPGPDVRSADDLVRNADAALYRAKVPGAPRHVVFDHTMQGTIEQRLVLEQDLARALERGELRVDYQPVVSLRSGRVWGFEALARWRHPVRGMVDAADFIPLAEQTGQVVAIDLWVLHEACAQSARWRRLHPGSPMRMSVNLSGKELLRTDLVEQVRRVLEQTGVDAPTLTLELPEAVFAERAESAGGMLQQLGRMDVHLQIDRFGSARSALHHLTHLPVAALKLAPALSDPAGRGGDVVRAAVSMAHSLALGVVANGVETREQLERMRAMDCDYAQGFALSPAVPAAAAEALMMAEDPFGVAAAWSLRPAFTRA